MCGVVVFFLIEHKLILFHLSVIFLTKNIHNYVDGVWHCTGMPFPARDQFHELDFDLDLASSSSAYKFAADDNFPLDWFLEDLLNCQ